MRVSVYGAGSVGGHLAVRLHQAGHDVSVVARGEHLRAIREDGLTLLSGPEELNVRVRATDDPGDLGQQDAVIVTLKSTNVSTVAGALATLADGNTPVVFAQNGVPWWYAVGLAPGLAPDLEWLDPGNRLHKAVPSPIGAVITSSNEVVRPGVIRNDTPGANSLVIGEVDNATTARVAELRAMLDDAGFASPSTADIRGVLWGKLVANMTVSVLCALTGLTAREAVEDPAFAALVPGLITEARSVAAAFGYELPAMGAGRAPDHRPSLLQDLERARPMEIDALVAAPLAFAAFAGVPVPMIATLGALATRRAVAAGLYRPR